jgi:hypothetical protein
LEVKSAFAIYPNPVKSSLRIDSEISFESAAIYDILGKLVWKGDFESELALDFIETGHYILTLTDENGASVSKRFVKE